MDLQTKFFLFIFLSPIFTVLFFYLWRKERELKIRKAKNSMEISLIELIKIRNFDFLEEDKIREILYHFKNIERNIQLISKLKGNPPRSLYSVVRRTLHLVLEKREVSFLASKEIVQKLINFVYEKALKPRIFESWWATEKDETPHPIYLKIFNIKNAFYQTESLKNDFNDSIISNQFLQSYTQKVINSLDTFSEDKLINNFFSEKDSWPKWIENTQEIKLNELPSGKIEGNVRGVFWLVTDSIANRIRYKLWERFTTYLLDYFGLKSTDISQWKNIEKVQETIYENPQTCFKLPDFIKPVIEEILEIAKKERKKKYQKFLSLNRI